MGSLREAVERLSGDYSLPLTEAVRRVLSALSRGDSRLEVVIEAPGLRVRLRPAGSRRVGSIEIPRTVVEAEGDLGDLEVVRRSLMLGGG